MDTKSLAHTAHPSEAAEEAPHGCYGGLVFLGYLVEDPDTGEEVEVVESVPCRSCSDVAAAGVLR